MTKSISVIVPCFNEESVVNLTYKRIVNTLNNIKLSNEIIFINDGSSDNTGEMLSQIAKNDKRVKVISLSRNFGHQKAVSAGINHCNGDLAVIIDADLQDPPELIPEMIETLENNDAQVVYCVRKSRKGEGFMKKTTAKLFYRVINFFSEIKLPVDTGDFRLIDKSVISEFNRLPEKSKYIRGLITWVGFKQIPFYYERDARKAGETKYPFSKMVRFAATSLLYFSTKPLKIATGIGFLSVLFALGLGIWSVLGKIMGYTHADTGWTSLFVTIVFFGGVQLITIGILGSYIGNLFNEIKNRPEYIIAKKENF